jgi:hypothetical protein
MLQVARLTDVGAAMVGWTELARELNQVHKTVVENITGAQKRQAEQYADR